MLTLVAVDLWLRFLHPLSVVPVASMEWGEIFNATRSVSREISKPDAAPYMMLLGSSLMVAPVVQAEAAQRGRPIERFFDRRSICGESLLKGAGSSGEKVRTVSVYNMAVGGEMASDAYFIARNFLEKEGERPVAIIYGVSPRDFQDNLMQGVETSQTFRMMGRLGDVPDIARRQKMPWYQSLDVALGRVWTLWASRFDLKLCSGLLTKILVEEICPFVAFEKYGRDNKLKRQRHGQFPEEVRGTPVVYPGLSIDHNGNLATRNRYLRSYNPLNQPMVDVQFSYFARFLSLAEQCNVSVLVVNMPLSQANKLLLPPGFYERYLARVKQTCAARAIEFADFNRSPWDRDVNFVDTVHLKAERSKAFLAELMAVAGKSSLSIALKRSSQPNCISGRKSTVPL